jgi:hypothetical protein
MMSFPATHFHGLIINLRVSYILDTNVVTPLAILFVYLGNRDISLISRACYTISVLFPTK